MDMDEFEATQNGGQPDADISTVKLEPNTSYAIDDESASEVIEPVIPAETPAVVVEPVAPKTEPTDPPATEPVKPVQTPEENAKFAEERRQKQADQRAKEALDKLKESDPAFRTAKLLEDMYGVPIDQIHERINQSRLENIAKAQNIPIETVQKIEEGEQTKQENIRLQYNAWTNRMDSEATALKQIYPNLTDDDMYQASQYMLTTLQNPSIPLAQAVHAIHGQKIADAIRQSAKNEALAEISGRTAAPLAPLGGRPAATATITDDERYVMKQMGISEADWLKYK